MTTPLIITAQNIPAAWEQSIIALYTSGDTIPTQYDVPDEPLSIDAPMLMTITDPSAQPRIHRNFPDSREGLAQYVDDVVYGARNFMVESGSWTYSYHKRITEYPGLSYTQSPHGSAIGGVINQLDYILDSLAACWHTRRAQAISWVPAWDCISDEPPCFQRLWARGTMRGEDRCLDVHLDWRSRDAYKAAFMNLYAFSALQAWLAFQLSNRLGGAVYSGTLVDFTNSYHIYGRDVEAAGLFVARLRQRTFEKRTWQDGIVPVRVGGETVESRDAWGVGG